mmetsp:Transcript_12548/g.16510  ORF Transcript_12548/g.16510 Transcript_12548/m.16510 type:complete len:373 (+) Transcript_12548:71-1189(+)
MRMAIANTVSNPHGTKRKRRHSSDSKMSYFPYCNIPCRSAMLKCTTMPNKRHESSFSLNNVMEDALRHVFLFLPASDLLSSVVLVQKQWNKILDDASFWGDIAANEHPHVLDIHQFVNEKMSSTIRPALAQRQHLSIKNLLRRELKDSMEFHCRLFWDRKIRLAEELPFPGKETKCSQTDYCGDEHATNSMSVTSAVSCREILLNECRFLVRLYCPQIDPSNAVSTLFCKPRVDKYTGFQFDGYNGFDFEVDIEKFRETIDLSSPQPLRIAIYLIHRGAGSDGGEEGAAATTTSTGSCLWVDSKFMKCNLCGIGNKGAYGCWLFDELHPTTNGIYLWQNGKQLKIFFCAKRVCEWKHDDQEIMNTWLKRVLE